MTSDLCHSWSNRAFFFGPSAWDSNPQGCGAEETRSVFQRSTRGAERRSGARAAPAARGHPSSPTTELETVLERGPFLFGPISWDSNPTGCGAEETRKRLPAQHARNGRGNAPSANACVQKMPNMSTVTLLEAYKYGKFALDTHHMSIILSKTPLETKHRLRSHRVS